MYVFFRDTQTLLLNLCDDVESGKAIGSLCKEFCSGALSSHNCLAFHRGKEVVFSAQFHGNTVYVKGKQSLLLLCNKTICLILALSKNAARSF
jgi:hypothetical protein